MYFWSSGSFSPCRLGVRGSGLDWMLARGNLSVRYILCPVGQFSLLHSAYVDLK